MAFSFQVLPHSLHFSTSLLNPIQASPPKPQLHFHPKILSFHLVSPARAAINGESSDEPPKPARRTRKKGTTSSSSSAPTESKPKKTRRSTKKSKAEDKVTKNQSDIEIATETGLPEPDIEIYDDGIDVTYQDPPLVCFFGSVQKEFVPTVRVSEFQQHPDMYSQWKMLHWDPPEFGRAPGGPASNVAISHVRLGGRSAFMGKVGKDKFGAELLKLMKKEKVQTQSMKIDPVGRTGCTEMKVKFEDGKITMKVVKEPAEAGLLISEVNGSVLKEARMFHFCSESLLSPVMRQTLFKSIEFFKKSGGLVFFDLNMPLPLWKSRDETRELIKRAWNEANIIEVSRDELEFLLDEEYYVFKKNYRHQYYAESFEVSKNRRHTYHYTREDISPLWHDGIKFLFVVDGTLRIHYYSPSFDGVIVGTEDVMVTPMTCDRTGSGDAIVAAIMRKLLSQPEMFDNQDFLERQLRFAVAAGIIAQWTIGAVRGFPTESASQNLKEQVYVPTMW